MALVTLLLAVQSYGLAAGSSKEIVFLHFEQFATGFDTITGLIFDADGRLFVVEKRGVIYVVQPEGTLLPTPFLDLSSQTSTESERGLLGMVLHPAYEQNRTFYVNYTDLGGATNVVSYLTSSSDENRAEPGSNQLLLKIDQPHANHNGGDLAFGQDGKLYIAVGDGGGGGDLQNNAQNGQNLLGTILRIDVDNPDLGKEYGIPVDNPFLDDATVLDEIWAMGLRNPWRISIDRATGDLYVPDVGQSAWEEVNVEASGSGGGANYGWRCYEGNAPFNLAGCADAGFYEFPVFTWGRNQSCAIIGGYVYRGELYKSILNGHYLFADFCSGRVRGLLSDGLGDWQIGSTGQAPVSWITSFGQAADGELYVAGSGTIYRITAAKEILDQTVYLPFATRLGG